MHLNPRRGINSKITSLRREKEIYRRRIKAGYHPFGGFPEPFLDPQAIVE